MTRATAVDFWNGKFADADGIRTPDGHEVAVTKRSWFVSYSYQKYLLLQKL